jgi:small-conductance mechanosensitive channel
MFEPLQNAISAFLSYVPQLIGAIIILIIGYLVARALQALVTRILQGIGFENWMERGGVKQFFDRAQTNQTPSSILGVLVFWFVFIIAITMAADALGIHQISGFLNQVIAYIPSILVAVLILFLAALVGNFLASVVRGATGSEMLASIARYAVIVYAVFAAITQLGIAVELTAPTFLILLGAVALALAIAFGIGGREVARDIIEKAYNRGADEAQRAAPTAGGDRNSGEGEYQPRTREASRGPQGDEPLTR